MRGLFRWLASLLGLSATAVSAVAQDRPPAWTPASTTLEAADRHWTTADTALQVATDALIIADWGQTRDIVARQARGGSQYEKNPILGHRPRRQTVDAYFASSFVAANLIAWALPQPYRRLYQSFVIGFEGSVVWRNAQLGLRVNF